MSLSQQIKLETTMVKTSLLILSVSLLSACSVVTEKKCLQTDWYEEGRQDGLYHRNGYQTNLFVEKCTEKYSITPDKQAYNIGYVQGIKGSCTREWAEQQGINNNWFDSSYCPLAIVDIVRKAYSDGRIQGLTYKVTQLKRTILANENQPALYETKLSQLEKRLNQKKTSSASLSQELDSIKSTITRLASAISHLIYSLDSPRLQFLSEDKISILNNEIAWLNEEINKINQQKSTIEWRLSSLERALDKN